MHAMRCRKAGRSGSHSSTLSATTGSYPSMAPRRRAPWIEISVEDNGTGMPKDVLDRVFEPFYTTKEIGKGSGLGLSRVYGFVRQSGGLVTLASSVGIGTRLSIYLPPSTKSLSE